MKEITYNEFKRINYWPAFIVLDEGVENWSDYVETLRQEEFFIDNRVELIGTYRITGGEIRAVLLEFSPGTMFNSYTKLNTNRKNIKWPRDFTSNYHYNFENKNN